MNRRDFVTKLLSVPVVALCMEKDALTEDLPLKVSEVTHPFFDPRGMHGDERIPADEVWPTAEGFFHGEDPFRIAHQRAANERLRRLVDDTAFDMMTGGKHGC